MRYWRHSTMVTLDFADFPINIVYSLNEANVIRIMINIIGRILSSDMYVWWWLAMAHLLLPSHIIMQKDRTQETQPRQSTHKTNTNTSTWSISLTNSDLTSDSCFICKNETIRAAFCWGCHRPCFIYTKSECWHHGYQDYRLLFTLHFIFN